MVSVDLTLEEISALRSFHEEKATKLEDVIANYYSTSSVMKQWKKDQAYRKRRIQQLQRLFVDEESTPPRSQGGTHEKRR